MSNVTLLRTMTGKSLMKFGNYADYRVSDVMCLGWKGRMYLIRAYYNLSNITFIDEVLDQLGITERIEKPGKVSNEQLREILQRISAADRQKLKEEVGEKVYMGMVQKRRKTRRIKQARAEIVRTQSKANATAFNQGHRV